MECLSGRLASRSATGSAKLPDLLVLTGEPGQSILRMGEKEVGGQRSEARGLFFGPFSRNPSCCPSRLPGEN